MSEPQSSIPVLEYPRDLYVGTYAYRSPMGFLGAIVCCAGAFAFWYVPMSGGATRNQRLVFDAGALLWAVVAALLLVGIIAGWEEHFRLTTTGIETGRKLVPWSKITRLAAKGPETQNSFYLFYSEKISSAMTISRALTASRRLTKSQYEVLIELLKAELSVSYPDLQLGGYFIIDV